MDAVMTWKLEARECLFTYRDDGVVECTINVTRRDGTSVENTCRVVFGEGRTAAAAKRAALARLEERRA